MHIHVKLRAKYRCMERNNLNMCQQIFMIFVHFDQTLKRKPPFDFKVHPICPYGVMGLRYFGVVKKIPTGVSCCVSVGFIFGYTLKSNFLTFLTSF